MALDRLDVTLLQKDLLYLCVALRDFPTDGDVGDKFASDNPDRYNPDHARRHVFNEVKLQTERLLKTLDGVEHANTEPVELEILFDLRWRVGHLFRMHRPSKL